MAPGRICRRSPSAKVVGLFLAKQATAALARSCPSLRRRTEVATAFTPDDNLIWPRRSWASAPIAVVRHDCSCRQLLTEAPRPRSSAAVSVAHPPFGCARGEAKQEIRSHLNATVNEAATSGVDEAMRALSTALPRRRDQWLIVTSQNLKAHAQPCRSFVNWESIVGHPEVELLKRRYRNVVGS